jgi:hypothetical protein
MLSYCNSPESFQVSHFVSPHFWLFIFQNRHSNATHTPHVMFTSSSPSEALQTLHKMILRVGKDGRLSDGRFIMNTRVLDQLCGQNME